MTEPKWSDPHRSETFSRRHIGPDEAHVEAMLKSVGAASLEDLMDRVVPAGIRQAEPLRLPSALTETEALETLRIMSERNRVFTSMIGLGYSGTITPGVIRRRVLENPGWYTAYTPYQPEVSQGRLEALLNFQQMVIDLTGMELANASLLDEATAAAEAMTMAKRVGKSKAHGFFVDRDTHPQTLAVIETRAEALGYPVVVGDPETDLDDVEVFAALLSYPGSSGQVRDLRAVIEDLHRRGALAIMATDLLSLALLTPPGDLGCDIAIGSAQRFGVPMGFGGPHPAFFATRDAFKRAVPGRIIGVSVDPSGRPALRMALQTREQHIRRDKATSNICTAQALLAIVAGFYAVYHGPDGIRSLADRVHTLTRVLATALSRLGVDVITSSFFDTITLRVPGRANRVAAAARERLINVRLIDADHVGVALDETTTLADLERLLACFETRWSERVSLDEVEAELEPVIAPALQRTQAFLTHPVFNRYRSETEMLRYMRMLQAKDIALDRSMIPLGSCTMKLNATTEMEAVTWRNFAEMHPFAPLDQAQGYFQLFEELEEMLCEITGFDAVSLQPNAGSQGEYAGLLTIRAWHKSRGDDNRDVCLIPASAHGTNPASAVMAGMSVVVVACDEAGNVDLADIRAKATHHADRLAALMVTYPSTHGVFEETIGEICDVIHENGGQVYLDGANLNALVGVARPAEIGADVCHMNLHKTFCIPHGGGGPGVGPIGVKAHLAPFLPDHCLVSGVNPFDRAGTTIGQIAAAPWGSALVLPISWAYIRMMGGPGLTRATQVAILNANYVARRLAPHYPIVYTGPGGWIAHECIVDLRGIRERSGITVEDVAKRLVDFGFHAPTVSWPVPDSMMIEPTESESKTELDRFCDAMIAIRGEIAAVEDGRVPRDGNPLVNAPHPADRLLGDWKETYSRDQAYFPTANERADKYWPPVGRIDNAHGDRNLVCTCPDPSAYVEAAE